MKRAIAGHVVEVEPRQIQIGQGHVAGDGDDGRVLAREQRRAALAPMGLELGVREALEALDQDQIDR